MDESRQILCFRRHDLLLAFNFSPTESYTNVELKVSGENYDLALSTDAVKYDGFGRVDESVKYKSELQFGQNFDARILRVYMPSRTALVFKCTDQKS
jgi:1,4-alpha-glucan branching enzyme